MSDLVIRDVAVLDCTGAQPGPRMDVLVRDGGIDSIRRSGEGTHGPDTASIDGAGCTLMPGLTDAHVHFAIIGRGGQIGDMPWIEHVLAVSRLISDALDEGFTTVRDAGGLEPTWAKVVEDGRIRGQGSSPRRRHLPDRRSRRRAPRARRGPSHAVDSGPRRGSGDRRRCRRGAPGGSRAASTGRDAGEGFVSGGLASPTDPLESLQLSADEIAAAVEIASGWGTYVLAHAHTSPAVDRAIENGVRSIEHGSMLEPATAARMAALGTFMVPTLQTIDELVADPDRFGLTPAKQARAASILEAMGTSVATAREAGVAIGSGSDVIGPDQRHRGREIVLKAAIIGAEAAIISATRTNAELFRMSDRIGTVEAGKDADLILVAGDPLDHVELLADPTCIPLVIKGGEVVKDPEKRTTGVTA